MRISQLEAFLAVYSLRSITKAADSLHVSQPALTKTLRLIESELGIRLFDRCPRGVEPTIYGHTLVAHAKHISAEFRSARSQIAAISGGHSGTVRIGASPYVVDDLIPFAVTRIVAKHPKLHVEVISGSLDILLSALETGELDLCVISKIRDICFSNVATIELTQDEFGVIARAGHPLLNKANVTLSDLITYPWVFYGQKFSVASQFANILRAQGLPLPDHITETDSMAYLISHLLRSDSLSYQPRHFAESPYRSRRLTALREMDQSSSAYESDSEQVLKTWPEVAAAGETDTGHFQSNDFTLHGGGGLRMINVPETTRNVPVIICYRKAGLLSPGGHAIIKELRHLTSDEKTVVLN
jgi:DNA-binding transcriptional LysR family regulator